MQSSDSNTSKETVTVSKREPNHETKDGMNKCVQLMLPFPSTASK